MSCSICGYPFDHDRCPESAYRRAQKQYDKEGAAAEEGPEEEERTEGERIEEGFEILKQSETGPT